MQQKAILRKGALRGSGPLLSDYLEVKVKGSLAGAKPINGPALHRFRDLPKLFLLEPIKKVRCHSRAKEELNSQLP